jgi:hypothetical protein
MAPHPSSGQSGLTGLFTRGVVRMLGAMPMPASRRRKPPRHRLRRLLRRPLPAAPSPHPALDSAETVALVAMALDRLGPAAVRASCFGVGVRVCVPDLETAAVFRAALAQTQRRRATDRLIEIIVDAPASQDVRPAGAITVG